MISPEARPLLKLLNAPSATGMPLVAPPEVPQERSRSCAGFHGHGARSGLRGMRPTRIGEPTDTPLDGEKLRALYADIIGSATAAAANGV